MSNSKKQPESGLSFSTSSDLENVAISDILRNLVYENSDLASILECSLELMDLFDPDSMVDHVISSYQQHCTSRIQVWQINSNLIQTLGRLNTPNEEEFLQISETIQKEIVEGKQSNYAKDDWEYRSESKYVLVMQHSAKKYQDFYIASLYFRHLIRALNTLKDRLVIAKAYQEIKEIIELKGRVEGSLNDIKDQSNSSINTISDHLSEIIAVADEIEGESDNKTKIHDLANEALNETQMGDLTNQKVLASLHNLEDLFVRLTNSLDETSKNYLQSLYQPSTLQDPNEVVSESLMEGQKADQQAIDSLLADLGL